MLAAVLRDSIAKCGVDAKEVQDIAVGNVLQPGGGAHTSRMGGFLADIPYTASLYGLNRQCSSGLQAVASIANQIKCGQIDLGIGAGVENMSNFSMQGVVLPDLLADEVFENEQARNCLMGMGVTSDNVAKEYGVTREEQDEFAAASQAKALAAQENGDLGAEITPVKTKIVDKDGKEHAITVTKDEGVRKGTTAAKLSKLKPAFNPDGTTTAGNASQVTDGAAAVILARRSTADRLGLKVLGRFHGFATAGVPPHVMGIGPAYAIPEVLKQTGFTVGDIDVFEVNEAFASQALFSAKKLGIPTEKLNPRGGAIALGHPLGATGARQIVTLFHELKKQNKRYGCTSMCIGTGMGAAGVFEREDF